MPGFVIANFRHVADGLHEGQFAVGEHKRAATLDDLDPIYLPRKSSKVCIFTAALVMRK